MKSEAVVMDPLLTAGWLHHARMEIEGEAFPDALRPETVDDGYRCQKAWIDQAGRPVVGWKLGGTTAATRQAFDTDSLYCGAMLGGMLYGRGAYIPANIAGARMAEAEIVVMLARDIVPDAEVPWTANKVVDEIAAIAPAVEIPVTAIADVATIGLPALLADNCASGALVIGEREPNWKPLFGAPMAIALNQSGEVIASGNSDAIIGGVVQTVADFLNLAARLGYTVRAGQPIATGGCTPCVACAPGERVDACFEGLGAVGFTFAEAMSLPAKNERKAA